MNVHQKNIIAIPMPTAVTLKDHLIVFARRDIEEMDSTVKVRLLVIWKFINTKMMHDSSKLGIKLPLHP